MQLYLIAYGGYRFLTEFIRPEPRAWLDLTFYQWVSLLLIAGMVGQWLNDAWPDIKRRLAATRSGARGPAPRSAARRG